MLKKITLENFVKHKNREISFNKGSTLIVGANGKGKSLVLEAIRFVLFGSQALRGKLDEYDKTTRVKMDLTIKGKDVSIERSLNDCKLQIENESVVGTKACNKAIQKLLGYGLTVFDMGNCAKQEEVSRLGEMKPSERKQAVDQVLGIDLIDKLVRELQENVSLNKGKLEILEALCVEPEKVSPPVYSTSVEPTSFEAVICEQEGLLKIIRECEIYLTLPPIKVPKEPEPFTMEQPSGDPSTEMEFNRLSMQLVSLYNNKVAKPDYELGYLKEQKEKCLLFADRDKLEQPNYTEDELKEFEDQWEKYGTYVLNKKSEIECPFCTRKFNPNTGIAVEEVSEPKVSIDEIALEKIKHNKLKCLPKYEGETPTIRESQSWFNEKIRECENYISFEKTLKETEESLQKMEKCDYEAWRKYNSAKKTYEYEVEAYEKAISSIKERERLTVSFKERLEDTKSKLSADSLDDLKSDFEKYKFYKMQLSLYESKVKEYESRVKSYEELKKEFDLYKSAIEGLRNFKLKVKSYVIPSLAKVASELVSDMTKGKFSKVEINDDFAITIDGKSLNLFSGSEKAVCNLALRIGLGRVLTHRSLNLFIGDEIDASCDNERAEDIMNSFEKLKDKIYQIVFISHHDIEADTIVEI